MLGDSLVVYEYCNVQVYISNLTTLASLDWSFWVGTLARGVTFMMHNFNHYMEKISLLDGTRCVLPPQVEDLDVSSELDPTLPFGTDIIVDPSDPNFSADSPVNKPGDLLGRGWEYTYV
jgi:hypothetical protein